MFNADELIDNPTARIPVVLCLDCSESMRGESIRELKRGVQKFYDAIINDEYAVYSAEVCIVTFNGQGAEKVTDFTLLNENSRLPDFTTIGETPLGEGVALSLKLLEERKKAYKDNGVDYYQPWLVIMTDGEPNGDASVFAEAAAKVIMMEREKKISVFPIGVGEDAGMDMLSRFTEKKALKLPGLKFEAFFQWLGQSVCQTSQTLPGEEITYEDFGWDYL